MATLSDERALHGQIPRQPLTGVRLRYRNGERISNRFQRSEAAEAANWRMSPGFEIGAHASGPPARRVWHKAAEAASCPGTSFRALARKVGCRGSTFGEHADTSAQGTGLRLSRAHAMNLRNANRHKTERRDGRAEAFATAVENVRDFRGHDRHSTKSSSNSCDHARGYVWC